MLFFWISKVHGSLVSSVCRATVASTRLPAMLSCQRFFNVFSTAYSRSPQQWRCRELESNRNSSSSIPKNFIWLVVDLPLWKKWKSVGFILPNIWKIKFMFQTTNQHSYSNLHIMGYYNYYNHSITQYMVYPYTNNVYLYNPIESNSTSQI